MLKKSKQLVLNGLKTVGAFRLAQTSDWRKGRLLIIGYHGVSIEDEHLWDPELFMALDLFRSRMQMLKDRNFEVLPLGEAVRRLYADELPARCVALTFDDGFYNFYKQVLPVLLEFQYPSTLYLTTYYVLHNHPVFDSVCAYLLWKSRHSSLKMREISGQDTNFDLSKEDEFKSAFDSIIEFARKNRLSGDEKDAIAAKMAKQLKIDYAAICEKRLFNLLNPEEVRQISTKGVDVQLHTHHHRLPLNHDSFKQEIEENRQFIHEMTGASTPHFCYPSGIYDDSFTSWLDSLQISTATTCDPGLATRSSNPLLLPRLIDTSPLSPIEFEGWLSGVSSFMPRRQRTYNPGAEAYASRSDVSVHG